VKATRHAEFMQLDSAENFQMEKCTNSDYQTHAFAILFSRIPVF
jgi:hypothetical protein